MCQALFRFTEAYTETAMATEVPRTRRKFMTITRDWTATSVNKSIEETTQAEKHQKLTNEHYWNS